MNDAKNNLFEKEKLKNEFEIKLSELTTTENILVKDLENKISEMQISIENSKNQIIIWKIIFLN